MKRYPVYFFILVAGALSVLAGKDDERRKSDEVDESGPYYLMSGDTITVLVFNHNEFDIKQRIDDDGNISLPLVDEVAISGMSVREAEDFIEKTLIEERLLAKPQVKITVQSYMQKSVVVLGQVMSPGTVVFPPEANSMRLIDVISKAGGLTRIAKDSSIRITHTDEEGEEEVRDVDIRSLVSDGKKGKADPDRRILVYPDDVIYIPERLF